MQRFRPTYYETFVCMADRCPRTCCQEWKIYVDEKTEKQWENLTPPQEVMPQKTALSDYIVNKEGSRVIHLDQAQRCLPEWKKTLQPCMHVRGYGTFRNLPGLSERGSCF